MKFLSELRICRIREQGYQNGYTVEEINMHGVGNRFAYQLCTILFTLGLVLSNIPILLIASSIAFFTVVLPRHPFDYIYNAIIAPYLNKPPLPKRSKQAKFACGLASFWLIIVILFLYYEYYAITYILGSILVVIALLVSTIDLCIPSKIYNWIFRN